MHKHHVDANFHQRYENSKGTIRFYQGKTFKMFFFLAKLRPKIP